MDTGYQYQGRKIYCVLCGAVYVLSDSHAPYFPLLGRQGWAFGHRDWGRGYISFPTQAAAIQWAAEFVAGNVVLTEEQLAALSVEGW